MNRKNGRLYMLLRYKNVIDIIKQHYIPGVSTYTGIYKKYVFPVYPMHFWTFMKIVHFENINAEIQKELEKSSFTQEEIDCPKKQLEMDFSDNL